MSELKIYRIRDRKTGQWSSGGSVPGFGKRGKTWDNLGHVSNHITNMARYAKDIYKDAEIVEYIITEAENRTLDVMAIIARKERKEAIYKEYGRSMSEVIEGLEKDGKLEDFRWSLTVSHLDADDRWIKGFKGLGIKRANYRTRGNVYAFNSKDAAMKARLSCEGKARSLDLVDLVEEF